MFMLSCLFYSHTLFIRVGEKRKDLFDFTFFPSQPSPSWGILRISPPHQKKPSPPSYEILQPPLRFKTLPSSFFFLLSFFHKGELSIKIPQPSSNHSQRPTSLPCLEN